MLNIHNMRGRQQQEVDLINHWSEVLSVKGQWSVFHGCWFLHACLNKHKCELVEHHGSYYDSLTRNAAAKSHHQHYTIENLYQEWDLNPRGLVSIASWVQRLNHSAILVTSTVDLQQDDNNIRLI